MSLTEPKGTLDIIQVNLSLKQILKPFNLCLSIKEEDIS